MIEDGIIGAGVDWVLLQSVERFGNITQLHAQKLYDLSFKQESDVLSSNDFRFALACFEAEISNGIAGMLEGGEIHDPRMLAQDIIINEITTSMGSTTEDVQMNREKLNMISELIATGDSPDKALSLVNLLGAQIDFDIEKSDVRNIVREVFSKAVYVMSAESEIDHRGDRFKVLQSIESYTYRLATSQPKWDEYSLHSMMEILAYAKKCTPLNRVISQDSESVFQNDATEYGRDLFDRYALRNIIIEFAAQIDQDYDLFHLNSLNEAALINHLNELLRATNLDLFSEQMLEARTRLDMLSKLRDL